MLFLSCVCVCDQLLFVYPYPHIYGHTPLLCCLHRVRVNPQYYYNTIAQYPTPLRPPVFMPYSIQHCALQYHVKAKPSSPGQDSIHTAIHLYAHCDSHRYFCCVHRRHGGVRPRVNPGLYSQRDPALCTLRFTPLFLLPSQVPWRRSTSG